MNPTTNDAESKSVADRIEELRGDIARFEAELDAQKKSETDYRAREDMKNRVSFAREIFEAQQDQRRIEVEIEILKKRIRRLELGYSEDAAPVGPEQHPLF